MIVTRGNNILGIDNSTASFHDVFLAFADNRAWQDIWVVNQTHGFVIDLRNGASLCLRLLPVC